MNKVYLNNLYEDIIWKLAIKNEKRTIWNKFPRTSFWESLYEIQIELFHNSKWYQYNYLLYNKIWLKTVVCRTFSL